MANKFLTDLDAANGLSSADQILVAQGSPIPRRAPLTMLKDALFGTGNFVRQLLALESGEALKLLIGLNRVDNTNDAEKPISTATQAALNLKANASTVGQKLNTSDFTWTNLPGKPSAYPPATHSHSIGEVTGLQAALDAKLDAGESPELSWENVTGKPATFVPSAHTHAMSEVTGLEDALAGKQPAGSYAPTEHTHAASEVDGLQAALDAKQDTLPPLEAGKVMSNDGESLVWVPMPTGGEGGGGTGDVTGPASATDNAIPRFDGGTGKAIQESGWSITDDGRLVASADNTQDIGLWNGGRPKTIYVGTHVEAGGRLLAGASWYFGWNTRARLSVDGNTVFRFQNWAADAWAGITAGAATFNGNVTVTGSFVNTALQTALDAKLATSSFTWANLTGKPTTFAPSAHVHALSDVTGLETALAAKLATADHTWANLTGKPTTFAPAAHTHAQSEITGLTSALAAKLDASAFTWGGLSGKPSTFTPATHAHAIADVTGLQAALDEGMRTTVSATLASGVRIIGNSATQHTSEYELGYRGIPINTQPSHYYLNISDGGKMVRLDAADSADRELAINPQVLTNMPVGWSCVLRCTNKGNWIVKAYDGGSPVRRANIREPGNANTSFYTLPAWGYATLVQESVDNWVIVGPGMTRWYIP